MKKILSAILAGVMILGLVGCGSKGGHSSSAKDVPTADLVNTVVKSEEIQMRALGPIEGELAETTFHLNPDDVEEYTIQKGMINTGLETVAVVKAKEGKVDAVKASLEEYLKDLKALALYPGEPEAVEGAVLEVVGNYVIVTVVPDYEGTGTNFSEKAANMIKDALK